MSETLVYMADFETTVYEGQDHTEVWAAACVELGTEDVKIFHSIGEQFDYFTNLFSTVIVYYHNLKFDGSFWLDFLVNTLKFKQAYKDVSTKECFAVEWKETKDMTNKSFKYVISNMGQFYSITIKYRGCIIEIRDSLKLLPFSVERIGKSFKTKHRKLHMEYEGYRYAGCEITDEEKKYIANDVLVVKEALEIMFAEGHNKLTIGSCCLAEFKKTVYKKEYKFLFPDLSLIEIDKDRFGSSTADEYIRKSYRGGWCYVVEGKQNKVLTNGFTADVNSLYPSMMSSESGNMFPIGNPTFWKGNRIEWCCQGSDNLYYFVRIKTRFKIKAGHLPFIQLKGNFMYPPNECLVSSDFRDCDGNYHSSIKNKLGVEIEARPELTLTMTDFKLLKEHYDLYDFEILDGCYFKTIVGVFDDYINKYKKIKQTSEGAIRELAKLFLNNLYGKMASSKNSSFKVAMPDDACGLKFTLVPANDKQIGYIPIGSAITSYSRNFTIRAAQQNFYGADKRGFVYADTDSIHCDLPVEQVKGIKIHPTDFCAWKIESQWDVGLFVRQKTYIEHVTVDDKGVELPKPFYNIKCAGLPEPCKNLFLLSMGEQIKEGAGLPDMNKQEVKQFLQTKRKISDFTWGIKIPGKLMAKRMKGGIVLYDTTYEMR